MGAWIADDRGVVVVNCGKRQPCNSDGRLAE
jgi:hypothetical protein